jgi:hypothetical protein
MILLCDSEVKVPGITSLHDVNRSTSVAKCGNQRNSFSISTLEENRSRKVRARKAFGMITFANPSKQLLYNDNVYKKGGGYPYGRTYDAKPNRGQAGPQRERSRAKKEVPFAI